VAAAVVIGLRVLVPLSILRFPLAGALLAMVLDALDVVLVDALAGLIGEPPGFGPRYSQIDKALDTWYLALELVVAWRRWPERTLRRTAALLFAWRLIGVVAFEVTRIRPLLLVFPNLFENFYLYVTVVRRWFPRLLPKTAVSLVLVLLILLIPKLAQEWTLHFIQFHPWEWIKASLGI
jgi:hypothetical protein